MFSVPLLQDPSFRENVLHGFQGIVLGNDCIWILTGWGVTSLQDPVGCTEPLVTESVLSPRGEGIGDLLISRDSY